MTVYPETVCPTCGKVVVLRTSHQRQSYHKHDKAFCSKECYYQSKIGKVKIIGTICHMCGKSVTLNTREGRKLHYRTGRAYCSKTCANAYRAQVSKAKGNSEMNRLICSARMRSDRNPMRNPQSRAKMQTTLRVMGWKPTRIQGNGRGPTAPQMLLASALGWEMEVPIKTGYKRGNPQKIPCVYKVDIANETLKIAIEVDGRSHGTQARKEEDAKRDACLTGLGWKVLRFLNQAVIENLAVCVQTVMSTISK